MSADERNPGEAFCRDCPDHEGCMTGYPCDHVKAVNAETAPAVSKIPTIHPESSSRRMHVVTDRRKGGAS